MKHNLTALKVSEENDSVLEIGSEFWDAPLLSYCNNLFPKSTQWFLSGRAALKAIISNIKGAKTVAIPSWCCDSIIKPFFDAGYKICFYPVYLEKTLIQKLNLNCDVLFVMDFFGYSSKKPDLKGYKGIVIRDVTHSLFSKSYNDADYYFGSLRKWCGIATGGYLWGKPTYPSTFSNMHYIELRRKSMDAKAEYISNGCIGNKDFLHTFNEAEELLVNLDSEMADSRDIDVAKRVDEKFIHKRRQKNAKVLMNAFSNQLIFKSINHNDCPMFVPIMVPYGKRDALRQYLINHSIYCPAHWPLSEYHLIEDVREKKLYEDELSLVCDQRYTEDDMYRLVDTINKFWVEEL